MITFRTIDLNKDRTSLINFRKDSFIVSFGNLVGFHEGSYLAYVLEKIEQYPDGFVMAELDGKAVGQLELSVKEYQGRKIGYVHLFYLVPAQRGSGIGNELFTYAMNFFKKLGLDEYHLRVAPQNHRARRFYEKHGMKEIGPELDGKVIRMQGFITTSI
ncbi:Acetyltransferase (GNAT) family protein [Halobacillus dabanensis]|uniref:Acetyltransferase (GNAT) family protein n=1 Tax=Halobacillus dabanensis TaxID=240302 RepID=A0A1I3PTH7_HALDA|nr:GNAT family N-acetyltransferase [Halobacillus dabanensis]SFJ24720.1 Acetyltransferase (GNAT) family protein [Halobacillus dabanensis]